MSEKSCSFTGYRPSKLHFGYNEEHSDCIKLKSMIKSEIENLINDGFSIFNSGMAMGIDIWCAEAVLQLKEDYPHIKLHAVIPCMGQESGWKTAAKERYNSIIVQADDVLYMSFSYTVHCMKDRNQYLVDKADLLFAVYDGKKGGTYQTISFAKKLLKKVLVLNPRTLEVSY